MKRYDYGWECLYKAVNYLSQSLYDATLDERVGVAVRGHLIPLNAENDLPEEMHECFKSFMLQYEEIPAERAIECIIGMYIRACCHRAPNSPEFSKFEFNT